MKQIKLMLGDNMVSLDAIPDNSIDSVVTDAPYGLKFMGKKWDYDVPSVEFWKKVYQKLKPGGHILSFGGTRTYHRMVVNIEDAGFEIRDQIMWLYGSGFPKSLNIGKMVDKIQGNDREVDEEKTELYKRDSDYVFSGDDETRKEYKITKGQSPYEGWGTALKPAQEILAIAKKPENLEGTALNLIYNIKKEIWKLYVKIVEQGFELNQVEQKEVLDTAQCLVEKNINIQVALQGLMDMSQLRLMENMNWNIVLLWHSILEDLLQKMSRYTTSTKLNLIIDLKTLKSLEWQNILENITQVKNNQTDGLNVNALTAVVLFNALNLKLKDIQQHSVEDNVIYKEDKMDCLNEPICVARKPLSEKSVAQNVLKWGTGGINIDGSRVGSEVRTTPVGSDDNRDDETLFGLNKTTHHERVETTEGRFPANIILECICDEVITRIENYGDKGDIHTNPMCPCYLLDEQSGLVNQGHWPKGSTKGFGEFGGGSSSYEGVGKKDKVKSGASRYFYQAKVSKAERNMGLDGFEDVKGDIKNIAGKRLKCRKCNKWYITTDNCKCEEPEWIEPITKNSHPTLKPVALMSYLVRLVTPPNGKILDPFMGSGSTGIAARLEGFRFCGMEMSEEYFKIAEARIENYELYRKFVEKKKKKKK